MLGVDWFAACLTAAVALGGGGDQELPKNKLVSKGERPTSPPPVFGFVSDVDGQAGTVKILTLTAVPRSFEKTVTIKQGGLDVRKQVVVTEAVLTPVASTFTVDALRVLDAEGRELPNGEAWQRVTAGRMVLMASDHRPVAPVYLKLLAKDALILARKPPPVPK